MMQEPPIAIMITWGQEMIKEKGGLLSFIRYFEKCMQDENDIWLQKSKNKPTQDILYVYIVVCNQVRYKMFYGGHESGPVEVFNGDGHSWSSRKIVSWPRLLLSGPMIKAPHKIKQKGFQGFRYVTKELF